MFNAFIHLSYSYFFHSSSLSIWIGFVHNRKNIEAKRMVFAIKMKEYNKRIRHICHVLFWYVVWYFYVCHGLFFLSPFISYTMYTFGHIRIAFSDHVNKNDTNMYSIAMPPHVHESVARGNIFIFAPYKYEPNGIIWDWTKWMEYKTEGSKNDDSLLTKYNGLQIYFLPYS